MDDAEHIAVLYRALLGREPDAPGLSHFLALAQRHNDLRPVISGILASEEYRARTSPPAAELSPAMRPSRAMTIVDVGAQKLSYEDEVYAPLLRSGAECRCIAFEPLANRRAEMLAADPNLRVLPFFIGDGSEQTFHINNDDSTSSLFPLNQLLNQHLAGLSHLRTMRTERVATTRLDDALADETVVDFLKFDIQGFELPALVGAEQVLARTNVIHCEVMLAPIYEGQPLFSEVEAHLRARHFEFIDFSHECRYPYAGLTTPERLAWADAVFFRAGTSGDDARAQAAIAASIYGKAGLSSLMLSRLSR